MYPFLLAPTGQTATTTTTSIFAKSMGVNASTGALSGVTLAWGSVTGKPSYYDAKAITSISRSGTTFTATHADGSTSTFDQQDNNSDTKVTNTVNTTTKYYLTGTTSNSTNTGTQIFDTGVFVGETAGKLCSTSYTLGSGTADMSAGTLKADVLHIPTASSGTTFGAGSNGQVLKTNGTTIYWGTDNNTQYSAGTGLAMSGTTINHKNSITASSIGSAQSPSHGGTFAIPKITYDAEGHITEATTVNITLPADNNTDTKVTQTVCTTDGEFPVLVRGTSAGTTTTTTTSSFAAATTINPSTGLITEAGFQLQRKYGTLVPFGTVIPENANLNTIDYIKVGNYYQSLSNTVTTFTNCPTQNAFMMQVLSPLSTSNIDKEATNQWVYRLRIIQDYTGPQYIQYVSSDSTPGSFTYGPWTLIPRAEADGTVGSSTQPVYLSNGLLTPSDTYAGGTAVTLNGTSKAKSTASFYAPTSTGTSGQFLKSSGGAPTWTNFSATASNPTLAWGTTSTVGTIEGVEFKVTMPANPNSDTHYTTGITAGASGTTTNSATTNGNTYIKIKDNSTHRGQVKIIGSGATTVTSDANGVITISSTDTNTHAVTSVFGRTGAVTLTKSDVTTALGYTPPTSDTNTHYTTKLYAGASGTAANAAATNPYLKVTDSETYRNQVRFVGGGATTVSSDANGNITISSTDTNTHAVTSVFGRTGAVTLTKSDVTTALGYTPPTSDTNTSHAHTAGNGLTISGSGGTSGTTTYSLANSFTVTGTITAASVVGAVWNDYAEYRETTEEIEAGRVVIENGNDTLSLSTKRLMPGANIVSDTFGFSIGETDTAKTPLAVSGRALAYPYEDRNIFKAGDPVCSGPNGTVSKMTREEVMMYPDRIIGTVSAIPEYETWGSGKVSVNGRIWIHIR